jgi:Methyltransferase domain
MNAHDRARVERKYWIRSSYAHAKAPKYFPDTSVSITYQPDVYQLALEIARKLGATRIVDVGCGRARKLATAHPEFEIVGVDHGSNIEHCRAEYPFGHWLAHDLAADVPIPMDASLSEGALVVCSDVIEHVERPEMLIGKLRTLLTSGARAVLISTPERDLTRGPREVGPPANLSHMREWSIREFDAWMEESGFPLRSTGLTRSNDYASALATILTVVARDRVTLDICKEVLVEYVPSDCTPKPHPLHVRLRLAGRLLLQGR